MLSIQPDSPGRGVAAFLPQPVSRDDEVAAENLVYTIYYYNVRCSPQPQPLADIEYRSSDGELDTRRHVFRWDLTPYNIVFQYGFEASRQTGTKDSTYYNLEQYVNCGGRPLDTQRPTTRAYISTTLSSQWHPTVGSGKTQNIYHYEIYAPGGIWVNETLDNRYRYPSQDEVAFPAGIAPQYIRSAQLFVLTGDRFKQEPQKKRKSGLITIPFIIGDDYFMVNDYDSPSQACSLRSLQTYFNTPVPSFAYVLHSHVNRSWWC